MARPRTHDRVKIIRAICVAVSNGALVKDAAADHNVTAGQVREWTTADPKLSVLYARAREDQAHALAEQALTIAAGDDALTLMREAAVDAAEDALRQADDRGWYKKVQELRSGVIARDRMRVDTLKWLASKIAPRNYGERLELAGDRGAPLHVRVTFAHE